MFTAVLNPSSSSVTWLANRRSSLAVEQRNSPERDCLFEGRIELGDLGRVDQRPEVQHGERRPLDDVAGIGGAPLLAVLETLAEVLGQPVPLGVVPDSPSVESLGLE